MQVNVLLLSTTALERTRPHMKLQPCDQLITRVNMGKVHANPDAWGWTSMTYAVHQYPVISL